MRYVNRSEIPPPPVLSNESEAGNKEKQSAIEHYERHFARNVFDPKQIKKFTFKAYKDNSVKQALEKLFKGKCAYCESRYVNIHPVDIEHWRPKAEVIVDDEGKTKQCGYYWLASSWDNLLPSCIDCNRVRRHFDYLEKKIINLGKGNWFPIIDKENRTVKHNQTLTEDPLLINPCEFDPELFLEFHEEGFVAPKPNIDVNPRKKAEASIRFYALNRTELVQERREKILLIKQKMLNITALARCLDKENLDEEIAIIIEELLSHELERLERFKSPEQPFSVMAKQLIEKFRAEI